MEVLLLYNHRAFSVLSTTVEQTWRKLPSAWSGSRILLSAPEETNYFASIFIYVFEFLFIFHG
jgi:hypothetical protein